jgi:soluble lytic murein transglycosylase-like protein
MTGAAAAVARVAQIETMIVPPQTAATTSSSGSASFASALQSAQAGTATPSTGALTGGDGAPAGQFDALINDAAQRNGVDPALLKGLVRQESNFNPNARSGAGAVGLTQLMPSTAASLGVGDPTDPAQAIEGGARYLRQQLDRFGGDASKALAAYNAGPGAVERFGGVPPYAETQAYVQHVLGYAAQYGAAGAGSSLSPTTLTNPITN